VRAYPHAHTHMRVHTANHCTIQAVVSFTSVHGEVIHLPMHTSPYNGLHTSNKPSDSSFWPYQSPGEGCRTEKGQRPQQMSEGTSSSTSQGFPTREVSQPVVTLNDMLLSPHHTNSNIKCTKKFTYIFKHTVKPLYKGHHWGPAGCPV